MIHQQLFFAAQPSLIPEAAVQVGALSDAREYYRLGRLYLGERCVCVARCFPLPLARARAPPPSSAPPLPPALSMSPSSLASLLRVELTESLPADSRALRWQALPEGGGADAGFSPRVAERVLARVIYSNRRACDSGAADRLEDLDSVDNLPPSSTWLHDADASIMSALEKDGAPADPAVPDDDVRVHARRQFAHAAASFVTRTAGAESGRAEGRFAQPESAFVTAQIPASSTMEALLSGLHFVHGQVVALPLFGDISSTTMNGALASLPPLLSLLVDTTSTREGRASAAATLEDFFANVAPGGALIQLFVESDREIGPGMGGRNDGVAGGGGAAASSGASNIASDADSASVFRIVSGTTRISVLPGVTPLGDWLHNTPLVADLHSIATAKSPADIISQAAGGSLFCRWFRSVVGQCPGHDETVTEILTRAHLALALPLSSLDEISSVSASSSSATSTCASLVASSRLVPKGVVLHGAPGAGKTTLTRAIARAFTQLAPALPTTGVCEPGTAGAQTPSCRTRAFIIDAPTAYVGEAGETEARLRRLIATAKGRHCGGRSVSGVAEPPCGCRSLVIIEDAEVLMPLRSARLHGSGTLLRSVSLTTRVSDALFEAICSADDTYIVRPRGGVGKGSGVASALQTENCGGSGSSVFWIAVTSFPAFLRPDVLSSVCRGSHPLELPPLTPAAREAILADLVRRCSGGGAQEGAAAVAEAALREVAHATHGFTPADLGSLVSEANRIFCSRGIPPTPPPLSGEMTASASAASLEELLLRALRPDGGGVGLSFSALSGAARGGAGGGGAGGGGGGPPIGRAPPPLAPDEVALMFAKDDDCADEEGSSGDIDAAAAVAERGASAGWATAEKGVASQSPPSSLFPPFSFSATATAFGGADLSPFSSSSLTSFPFASSPPPPPPLVASESVASAAAVIETQPRHHSRRPLAARILSALRAPLVHSDRFAWAGVRAPRGVLVHGPTGLGKTLSAAAAVNVLVDRGLCNALWVGAGDIVSALVGASEAALASVFAQARCLAPCVLVLDNFETLAAVRQRPGEGAGGASGAVMDRLLSVLLTEMDGLGGSVSARGAGSDAGDAKNVRALPTPTTSLSAAAKETPGSPPHAIDDNSSSAAGTAAAAAKAAAISISRLAAEAGVMDCLEGEIGGMFAIGRAPRTGVVPAAVAAAAATGAAAAATGTHTQNSTPFESKAGGGRDDDTAAAALSCAAALRRLHPLAIKTTVAPSPSLSSPSNAAETTTTAAQQQRLAMRRRYPPASSAEDPLVIVLAITRDARDLDPAILRPGRLDVHLRAAPLSSPRARQSMLRRFFARSPLAPNALLEAEDRLAAGVLLSLQQRRTEAAAAGDRVSDFAADGSDDDADSDGDELLSQPTAQSALGALGEGWDPIFARLGSATCGWTPADLRNLWEESAMAALRRGGLRGGERGDAGGARGRGSGEAAAALAVEDEHYITPRDVLAAIKLRGAQFL